MDVGPRSTSIRVPARGCRLGSAARPRSTRDREVHTTWLGSRLTLAADYPSLFHYIEVTGLCRVPPERVSDRQRRYGPHTITHMVATFISTSMRTKVVPVIRGSCSDFGTDISHRPDTRHVP